MSAKRNLAVLDRVFTPAGHEMTPDVARWIAGIRADDSLQSRFDELADKNTEGVITGDELAEYDDLLQASQLLAVLQAKAREVLASKRS